MSTPSSGAIPHSREAAANHSTPTTHTRRRPNRSPSAPPSTAEGRFDVFGAALGAVALALVTYALIGAGGGRAR
ncbi:hypothetical protein ACWEV9_11030 [Streptomyces albogriseolus]|uniref:hypothetical protein n=1 Tax=Streptomyces albogriseolus TaxID=1887 RepID=UPI00382581CE